MKKILISVAIISLCLLFMVLAKKSPATPATPAIIVSTDPLIKSDIITPEKTKSIKKNFLVRAFDRDQQKAQSFKKLDETGRLVLDTRIRDAVVNVLCLETSVGRQAYITGSGVVIDSSGVVLTNAHVAQHILRGQHGGESVKCTVRNGDPASGFRTATLMYMPEKWVTDNFSKLQQTIPTGTGEMDFALLQMDPLIQGEEFPFLPLISDVTKVPEVGEVMVAGYPAGSVTVDGLINGLSQRVAQSHIQDVYTFGFSSYDLFAVPVGDMAEHGISGGVVVNSEAEVIGIVATAIKYTPLERSVVNAVTVSHIDEIMRKTTNKSVAGYVAEVPQKRQQPAEFAELASYLVPVR